MLISKPNERLIKASIERMNIFGILNILDAVAQRFGKWPQEAEELSYAFIFSISLMMKYESDIKTNLENEH